MKILVTGKDGQLGTAVTKELRMRGHDVTAPGRQEMDITDEKAVRNIFSRAVPEAVVHCAAYTNVDMAEEEKELCEAVNVKGTEHIVRACKEKNSVLLFVSTDYVFKGEGQLPQRTEQKREPLNVYGRTKAEGEQLIQSCLENYFIVRTSWIFGRGKQNFVDTILGFGKQGNVLRVVDDQTGSPTYAPDLAKCLADMLETGKYGVYHVTNEGTCSWFEFAEEILKRSGIETEVFPVSSEEYGAKADRPHNSRLDKSGLERAGVSQTAGLERCIEKIFKRYLKDI